MVQDYEVQHMVPSESAHRIAVTALEHIQRRVPNIPALRSLVSSIFISLLDDQVRTAMM